MKKILAWNMDDIRYVGDVDEKGTWFDFAIMIKKFPNKTYKVDVWESDSICEDPDFMEPTYQELKLYSEKLLETYRGYIDCQCNKS